MLLLFFLIFVYFLLFFLIFFAINHITPILSLAFHVFGRYALTLHSNVFFKKTADI